jgi:NADH-quinone oxidoreductase subunit K
MIDAILQGPGIWHWLTVTTLLFAIGFYGILTRRNAIGILLSIELMINSAILNFLIFNRFVAPASVDGEVMALFMIAVAAAEAAVALAIFVSVFKFRHSLDITEGNLLCNQPESSE